MDAIEMHRQPLPVRLLGWDDLRAKGIKDSKPTIYRKIKAGRFPRPIYPGERPQTTALEQTLVLVVVACAVAFEVWFFFFSGSPI